MFDVVDEYARHKGLSAREAAVLQKFISGKKNKEIAAEMGIAHSTVRQYWARMCTKVGVADATGVMLSLLRHVHRRARPQPAG